jgi:hypothetical protein
MEKKSSGGTHLKGTGAGAYFVKRILIYIGEKASFDTSPTLRFRRHLLATHQNDATSLGHSTGMILGSQGNQIKIKL